MFIVWHLPVQLKSTTHVHMSTTHVHNSSAQHTSTAPVRYSCPQHMFTVWRLPVQLTSTTHVHTHTTHVHDSSTQLMSTTHTCPQLVTAPRVREHSPQLTSATHVRIMSPQLMSTSHVHNSCPLLTSMPLVRKLRHTHVRNTRPQPASTASTTRAHYPSPPQP